MATRESIDDPFSAPVMLGGEVNTTDKNETRPSFSWDGQTLYFGRTPGPEGSTDIHVTTRSKLPGSAGRTLRERTIRQRGGPGFGSSSLVGRLQTAP